MTAATSFKQLYQDGDIKKKDIFRMPYSLLKVQPGFNPRDLSKPETQAKIQGIKESIKAGAFIPPLLVRVVDGHGVITDGECRFTAYGLAIAEGCEIEMVDVQPDTGNDADRVATAITTSQGEALTPLETALAYKRLAAFNWEPDQIAARVGKTRTHVDGLLILGNANNDVHQLVREGVVAAHVAIDVVRKHGENAGQVLRGEADKAKAAGKKKVTAGTIKGAKLPQQVVQGIVEELDVFMGALPAQARERLAGIEDAVKRGQLPEGQEVSVPASALLSLMSEFSNVTAAREKSEQRMRDRAAKAAQQEIAA
ncbi:ParB/RepB/Spo0J family partition protein [Tardiphaga sp. 20_F10_N6_6]|uniref:ParB/RepB/Spo0J family partition protein n=1 Tax=Tardiphaga sp. 20_F10_N6_6 TaxID=3240788 RepID=UPI003F8C70E7